MGGEGHMLDMIRRLSEGREASRLRRERTSEKLKHMNQANDHYSLPDTTPEEMERSNYFVWGTLIIMGALILIAVILWAIFIK